MKDMIAMNTFEVDGTPVYYDLPKNWRIIVDLLNSSVNANTFNMNELLDILTDKGYTAVIYHTSDGKQSLQEPSELLHMTPPQRIEFAPCTQ